MSKKINENDLPEGYRVKVQHLHQGNVDDLREIHRGAKYITVARIEDDKRHIIATAQSVCSKKDNPSRKLGRTIAVGRVLKKYQEQVGVS